jgi:hypothetical protein
MRESIGARGSFPGLELKSWKAGAMAVLIALFLVTGRSLAQTGGNGAISGTVTDSTGAVVPNANVVALNNGTGVETKRTSSSDGCTTLRR